jgi:hypothetical protein
MFPFHTLTFTLRLVMLDPCFTSLDNSFQEGITFVTTAIQKPFADVQTFLFVRFCELLWDPSRTDFMQSKSVVDNFIG